MTADERNFIYCEAIKLSAEDIQAIEGLPVMQELAEVANRLAEIKRKIYERKRTTNT